MKKFGIETDVKLSFSKPKTNFRQVYQKHQRIEMTAMLTSLTSALKFLFRNTLQNELLTKKLILSKNANNKKCASKFVFFNEKKIEKDSDDF